MSSWAKKVYDMLPASTQDQGEVAGSWSRRMSYLADEGLIGGGGSTEVIEQTTAPTADGTVLWLHPSKTVNSNENIPTLHEVQAGAWVEVSWKVGGVWQDTAPVAPPAPVTGTWTRTETEGLPTTGTWYSDSSTVWSGGATMYTAVAASTMSFTFTGTGIRFISMTAPDQGIIRVYIDDVDQGNVDLYAATTTRQIVGYENSTLTNASHTIRIEVTGTKNPSATHTTVIADAFEVLS